MPSANPQAYARRCGYADRRGRLDARRAQLRPRFARAGPAGRGGRLRTRIWVYDHLLYRFPEQPTGGIWEAWTMLVALAEATERVELGTIVLWRAVS